MKCSKARIFALVGALAFAVSLNRGAEALTFSNLNSIAIPASGTEGIANPYPSVINVSGLAGTIADVNVTINGLSHTFPDDIDILLVGPGGQKIILLSDAGGPHDIVNLTLTFDDEALTFPSNGNTLVSGLFKPVNYTGNGGPNDVFPLPAPAGPYGSLLSAFDGSNPNGDWKLFVVDDEGHDVGRIANGWTLEIATAVAEPSTMILVGAGMLALVARRRKSR
jgi:subtilisin-like proprotein convertase family protein